MPFVKGQVNYHRKPEGQRELTAESRVAEVRELPIVARFMLADVPDRGVWLTKRLAHKWPHLSEASFAGRLRAWISSNSHHLVKSAHAVALFRVTYHEIAAAPLGEEVFLFSREPGVKSSESERDAIAIYRNAARWAKGLGCSRLLIGKASDHCDAWVANQLSNVFEDMEISITL